MSGTANIGEDVRNTAQAFAAGVNQKVSEMLSALTPVGGSGTIENQGMLDLTGLKSAEELSHIRALRNVGLILIPETLTGALARIPQSNIGGIVAVPALEGGKLRIMSGQLKLSGDAFAGDENANDLVLLAGQIIFTSVVQPCRVRGLIIAGQLCAPKGSEAALSKAILRMGGQAIYYPAVAEPRILLGNQDFEELYFQSLAKPVVLVLIGHANFADDVTAATLKEKLAGLVVIGALKCSAAIKPIVQALCSECVGNIEAR